MSIKKYKSYNINILLKHMLYKQNYYLKFYKKTKGIHRKIKWSRYVKKRINNLDLNNIRLIVIRIQQDISTVIAVRQEISLTYYKHSLKILLRYDLAISYKPPGITMQAGIKYKKYSLMNVLLYLCKNFFREDRSLNKAIQNRLDKNTSGLIITFGNSNYLNTKKKTPNIVREAKKNYLLLVYKVPIPNFSYIVKATNRFNKNIIENNKNKISITYYKTIKTFEKQKYSLLKCIIKTGRRHQIRIHMNYIHSPIVGDKYNLFYYKCYKSYYLDIIKILKRYFLSSYKIEMNSNKFNIVNLNIPIEYNMRTLINLLKEN